MKEMFCLTTHSAHFIYAHVVAEEDFLSCYLSGPLPNVWHHINKYKMCRVHHLINITFLISSKESYMHQDIAYITSFVTPVVKYWLELDIFLGTYIQIVWEENFPIINQSIRV